jgi:hypothetical protein
MTREEEEMIGQGGTRDMKDAIRRKEEKKDVENAKMA